RGAPPPGTNQATGCSLADFWRDQKFGLRARDGVFDWPRQFVRPADCNRSCTRSHFRFGLDERLERARRSSVGIPTAWSVSGQKLLHQHFALGRNIGSAGTISQTVAAAGSRTVVLSSREK